MATNGRGALTARQRRPHRHHRHLHRIAVTLVAVAVLCVQANQLQPVADVSAATPQTTTGICRSVDVRNTLDTFHSLDNCRVVEGFVQILLFDNVNETALANISFPHLTEITDFLLLYRVNGLRSVGQLFPNLAVIRGQNLLFNYAFVVYEMSSLQEIGLFSLTHISRGSVRIDKNPSLCFVNSINWDLIVQDKSGEHFIKSMKPANECPSCPGEEKIKEDEYGNSIATLSCPKAQSKSNDDSKNRHLCWNRQGCQRVCPSGCDSCNIHGQCCDRTCLGGCAANNTNSCTVCRNIEFEARLHCINKCPPGLYQFRDRRCVTREECINMPKPIDPHSKHELDKPYKIFNESCILQCPTNYMSDKNHGCQPCKGRCKKECPAINIDSITLVKQLRGCTRITGSLEIQIRGGKNIVNELEENLNMIEEIDGYLKVVRSFPLVSLSFFKNLKRIRGNSLESQKYVFVVLDNQNLLDLWDWTNRSLKIEKGRLFFHFNPKLCLKKIEILQQKVNMTNVTDLEVARNSNGDKVACDVEVLNVTLSSRQSKAVVLEWEQFQMHEDQRSLLAYIVSVKETQYRNVTLYDGRDACGGDGWRLEDVPIQNEERKATFLLASLNPYTQYAFYVKTYTIAKEGRGAQSPIQYFRTLAARPSMPYEMQLISNASDALKVSWKPPRRPNGNITHYIVSGKKLVDMVDKDLSEKETCASSLVKPSIYHTNSPAPSPVATSPSASNDSCICYENKPASTSSFNENDELSRIQFEDELQNEVYVRNDEGSSRQKRELSRDAFPYESENSKNASKTHNIKNSTENNGTDIWETFSFTVQGKNEFYITNLHHYTMYSVYIEACRQQEPKEDTNSKEDTNKEDSDDNCSLTSQKNKRTLPKEGADDILEVQVTNTSVDSASITWKEPDDPNGVILSYSIEYRRRDNENSKETPECITHTRFLNQSRIHTLKKLSPGNYSVTVFATSTYDNGKKSPEIFFSIEEPTSYFTTIMISCFLISVATLFGIYLYIRKRQTDKLIFDRLVKEVNPEYVPRVYVPDEWEVPRANIQLIRELGQGSFGMVYEGVAKDLLGVPLTKCAIKTVNEHSTNRERSEFLNEASVMKAFDTTHVVRLLGVVSQGQPTLVIMELMTNGDLKSYLRSHRPDATNFDPNAGQAPTLKQILQMAIEIADGMAYLATKKYVHRDLAARNCMVAEDLTVKIGDFGMTRDIYETDYYRKGTKGLLPVRWMAPESLKDGIFNSWSDVWSYGVVLWEMATLASQPYQGLTNDQTLRFVIDGGLMQRPENCPDKLYTLMLECWKYPMAMRPSFLRLVELLKEDANEEFPKVSFFHSPAGMEARSAEAAETARKAKADRKAERRAERRAARSRRGIGGPPNDDPSTPLRFCALEEMSSMSEGSESDDDTNIATFDKDAVANGYLSAPTNGQAASQC